MTGIEALVAGLALLGVAAACWPVAAACCQRLRPQRRVFFARWGFAYLLGAALAGVAAFLLVGALLEGGAVAALVRSESYLLGALPVALLAAHRMQPEGWRALGLDALRPARAVSCGLVVALIALPAGFGAALAWPEVVEWLGGTPGAGPAVARFGELTGDGRWAAIGLTVLVAPALREAFFRGFAQPLLIQNFSERGGLFLSALVFAAIHPPGAFAPALCLGLAAAWAHLLTGSLLAPLTVHVLHQSAAWWALAAGLLPAAAVPLL